ncbi:MAG: serine/threonine-protein kinase [Gammaproteobacteria bacterium]
METTLDSQSQQGAPAAVLKALDDLVNGAINLKQAQSLVAGVIKANPPGSKVIQQFLLEQLSARKISAANYLELMAALENAIAECEDKAPEQPEAEPEPEVKNDTAGLETIEVMFDVENYESTANVADLQGTLTLAEDIVIKKPVSESGEAAKAKEQAEEERGPGVGSELCGRYSLKKEVASGSMGIVYRAVDMQKLDAGARNPYVAVKMIGTEFTSQSTALKSFQNEIDNTAHLSHPNIVKLFNLERDGNHYFMTMEWLEGESLDALLDRSEGSALPPTQTYAIIEQLCDALIYAHENNVIHADIKPGNVFLVETGEMKLIDWGIACAQAGANAGQSKNGVALTPAYASCERLEKAAPTESDDLYSLGCMIYRLLSGRRVFGSMDALEAEKERMQPVQIGGISESRWWAIARSLSFRRADRHASVREFAEEFGQRAEQRYEVVTEEAVEEFSGTMIIDDLPSDFAPPEQQNHTVALDNPDLPPVEAAVSTSEVMPAATSDHSPGIQFDIDLSAELAEELNDTASLRALGGNTGENKELSDSKPVPAEPVIRPEDLVTPDLTETHQMPVEGLENVSPEVSARDEKAQLSPLEMAAVGDDSSHTDADPFTFIDTSNLDKDIADEVLNSGSAISADVDIPFTDTMNLDAPDGGMDDLPFVDPAGAEAIVAAADVDVSFADTMNLDATAPQPDKDSGVSFSNTMNLDEVPLPQAGADVDVPFTETMNLDEAPAPYTDTINLESSAPQPDAGAGVSFSNTMNLDEVPLPQAGADVDVPFTETMNLDEAPAPQADGQFAQTFSELELVNTTTLQDVPEPINIFDGDGAGLDTAGAAPVADAPPPPTPPPAPKKPAAKKPATKKPKPAKKAAPEPEPLSRATNQLRGGGQRQVHELNRSLPARTIQFAIAKPVAVAVCLLSVISSVVVVSILANLGDEQPIPVRAEVTQPAMITRPDVNGDSHIGMPVQVDLSAPGEVKPVEEPEPVAESEPEIILDVSKAAEPFEAAAAVEIESIETPLMDKDFLAVPVDVPIVESVSALSKAEQDGVEVVTETTEAAVKADQAISEDRREFYLGLANRARNALRQEKLNSPDQDNASYWIVRLRDEGAPQSMITGLESELVVKFIKRGEDAYIRGELDEASKFVDLAASHGAAEDDLAALRSSISRLRR